MEQNVTGHSPDIRRGQRGRDRASLAASRLSPLSVAKEELRLVVRVKAGSHDSWSLFLTLLWVTLWPWTSPSTFLGLMDTHLVLPVSLRFHVFVFLKCYDSSGETLQKKYWFWSSRALSESGFANRGATSLLTCLFKDFFSFFHLELYLVYFGLSVLLMATWWPLLKAQCWSSCTCNELSNLCDFLIVFQIKIKGRFKCFHN